jgi:hypothetical protein
MQSSTKAFVVGASWSYIDSNMKRPSLKLRNKTYRQVSSIISIIYLKSTPLGRRIKVIHGLYAVPSWTY